MNRRNFTKIAALSLFMGASFDNEAPNNEIILYGDGKHDDTVAIQCWLDGKEIFDQNGNKLSKSSLPSGKEYKITKTLNIDLRDGKNSVFNFGGSTLRAGRGWLNLFRPLTTMIRIIY